MIELNESNHLDIFQRLFESNYHKAKKTAYNLLKSELDAEDVAQEVFTRLWERKNILLNNKNELDSYILTMARNIALNISKHEQIKRECQNSLLEVCFSDGLTDAHLLERIHCCKILEIVQAVLATIPDRRRKVFELSRFYEKSHKEIAAIMGISVHTVERQIYLTLTELRKIITAFA